MTDDAERGARVRCRLLIRGRVQGVWYRGSARETAARLGVSGWVRNLRDGRVEAEAEGCRGSVERLIAWCHEGPPAARVTDVNVMWIEPTGADAGFEVRRG
jgi:acylphosphatase